MSRKRFLSMVTAIVIMAAMGFLILYMTLGRLGASLRAREHPAPASSSPGP